MKRLLILLITGFLAAQEFPALRLEEFTIVGIDTLKARRGIVDVVPGFRTSIPIPDPDLAGFIVDKFPVKTIEIKPPESNEKKKILFASLGFGYGNNVHIQTIAGRSKENEVVIGNFEFLGPVGGDRGVTELEGFGHYFRKLSNSSLFRLSGKIYGRFEKAANGSSSLDVTQFIPSFAVEYARLPVPKGIFFRTRLGTSFLTSKCDTLDTNNKTALDVKLEAGYVDQFKISGLLTYRTLGDFSLSSGILRMFFGAGKLKSHAYAGYAYANSEKGSLLGGLNLIFPLGSKFKILANAEKIVKMADYSDILRNAAFVGDFERLDENFFEVTTGFDYSGDRINIKALAGYRQFSKTPLLIRRGNFWTFGTDTIETDGAVLRLEVGNPDRFEISGETFFTDKFKADTLLPGGRGTISFINPESGILPGIKLGVTVSLFGDDIVISQGLELYKTIAGSFGAFVELTNPVKEGYEIFTPAGYDISNGFSLTLGFTLKF